MREFISSDLLREVRMLSEVVSPLDPEAAALRFDHLVATHGKAACAAALWHVAPEVQELAARP